MAGKQIPIEVTQGIATDTESRPFYADEEVPVEQRGGVPESVWEANRANQEDYGFDVPEDNLKSGEVDPASQPTVPIDYTAQEQARAAALGEQKLASERELGNTPEQQLERQRQLEQEAQASITIEGETS